MHVKSQARLSPEVKEEIRKHSIAPNESYDNVLARLFGIKRTPKPFTFKNQREVK